MASLRLAIAASLKRPRIPIAVENCIGGRREAATRLPSRSRAKQRRQRRPAPPQKSEAKRPRRPSRRRRNGASRRPRPKAEPATAPAAPRKRSSPAAAPAPRKRDKKLDIKVGDQVDALWPADGEYYPAKVRAVNADGTIALDYADGDRRNDATTSELRCKRQATPAEADPDFAPAAPSTADAPAARSTITDKKALEARMAADGWTKEEKQRGDRLDKYWIDPEDAGSVYRS